MKSHARFPLSRGKRSLLLGLGGAALLAVGFLLASPLLSPAGGVKIYLADPGVYRVTFEDLRTAGVTAADLASDRLAMTSQGQPVPLWLEDGEDGRFGPGDHLEFLGERLEGERSFYNEHSNLNVYRLDLGGKDGARVATPAVPAAPQATPNPPDVLRVEEHLEQDRLLLRFSPDRDGRQPEPWYWAKLTHIDRRPFRQDLDLRDYLATSTEPLTLRIHLRGWSVPSGKTPDAPPDHRVEVALNQTVIGHGEWNGQDEHVIEIAGIPYGALAPGNNRLTLHVPERRPAAEADPIVDVVMLNWIEISYPRVATLADHQVRLRLAAADPTRPAHLATAAGTTVEVFGDDGSRVPPETMYVVEADGQRNHYFYLPPQASVLHAVPHGAWLQPLAIERDQPSDLRSTTRQADYVMITHPRLREAIEPLARFHEKRGLEVAVVDVGDVYDEFNHGILHPQAIHDFLSHAYHAWRPPAPRFVLLVGDASWDTKNPDANDANYADWTYRPGEIWGFFKNQSTPYSEKTSLAHRNLVPAWHYESYQGHAASDNWFVAVDGDDFLPDMAIGRFPVTEPAEVAAIVDKTIRYATEAGVGPWRRRVLWITNEQFGFQQRSDKIATAIAPAGYDSLKVYPQAAEATNDGHRATLLRAFDEGQLLVHFFGHGGRYIWRTGPPDYRKNHDLFTLEDLEKLAPTVNLPVVLSMTCYSAPFDHPTADSIGEKFLRLPGRGALAVVAASWRNSPSPKFSEVLVSELTRPGGTLGDAFILAKQAAPNRGLVEMYNLLGDPAIELALPQLEVDLVPEESPDDTLTVNATIDRRGFAGRALLDWLDADGEVIASQEMEVRGSKLRATQPGDLARDRPVAAVRVYVWNEKAGLDGVGGLSLVESESPVVATLSPAASGAAR